MNNSGSVALGEQGVPGSESALNVTGKFTNESSATLSLYVGSAANIGTLVNSGTVNVPGPGSGTGAELILTAPGTDTNSGTINLGGTYINRAAGWLIISAPAVTLSGSGKVIMANLSGNLISAYSSTDVLTSATTIEGSGTIGGMGFLNKGTVLANQSTPLVISPSSNGFSNQGTLSVDRGDTLQITGPAGSFFNYNSTTSTLTGGTYLVSGRLEFGVTGNTITTDAAKITLSGSGAKIIDPSGGNIIAPLATISTGCLFDITGGANFTTEGNFTNNGSLTVGSNSKFEVNGNLTNDSTNLQQDIRMGEVIR